ncbi:MAG: DUF4231 domain-containing protein [Candidatus Electrothrix scaldis]|nr:MAG: DUF4231 domain-containing protein [Candidatus Electrothrix sp. GW3-3]
MDLNKNHSTRTVLKFWGRRNVTALNAHYAASKLYAKKHYLVGIPAVVLASFVGTSVFASLSQEISPFIKIVVSCCSALAAILAGVQTFLNYSQKSEKHRLIASKYSSMGREIEQLLTNTDEQLAKKQEEIDILRKKIDLIAQEAPILPKGLYENAYNKNHENKF